MDASYPIISGRPIRIALVGCGRISTNHFEAFKAHPQDLQLMDVCDIDPGRLKAAVERTGAAGHASLTGMLKASSADVVALATPSGLHPQQAIQVAQPAATSSPRSRWRRAGATACAWCDACDEAGVRLFVVKQNRRNATLQLLKQRGRRRAASAASTWSTSTSSGRGRSRYYDSAAWRGTWEFDGGAFMNQASHYVDLLDWLVGPVESVQAYTATLARNIEVEDTGVDGAALAHRRAGHRSTSRC